jgi:phosphoenolpyruvate-protein phosphotransferase (PTS system enzyme I)
MKKNTYKGTPISPGIAIGKSLLLEKQHLSVFRIDLEDHQVEAEIMRLKEAIHKARSQITLLKEQLSDRLGQEHGYIMDAQLMMLSDKLLVDDTIHLIRTQKVNAEWALNETAEKLTTVFENMKQEYFKERVTDVEDVIHRLQANLAQINVHDLTQVDEDIVILSYQMSPSDIVELQNTRVVGFATELGGRTSHTAIIARSLKCPAITGIGDIDQLAQSGEMVIIDGHEGTIIVNPTTTQMREYENKKRYYEEHARVMLTQKELPAITKDGRKVTVQANIELPEELETAIRSGAQGIGIYRSEFLYLSNPDRLPSEEEHFVVYRNVAEKVYPSSAIVRTADLGAEKFTPAMGMNHEPNPALGIRGIRFCLQRKEMFKTQLRALLRASIYGRLKIMFPMVSDLSELREAKAVLEEAKEDLRLQKIDFNENVAVGIMIEVPSAALTADLLAQEVDFFSLGTNDLIQYLLAIDRNNDRLSYLYDPLHPAVIRTMKYVVEKGHEAGVKVGLCGEVASDPQNLIVLLGLGLDELSMNPVSVPLIKHMIRSLNYSEAHEVLEHCLKLATAQEVNEYLLEKVNQFFPSGFFASQGGPPML